jgi:general L-amino acid transport system permease protein
VAATATGQRPPLWRDVRVLRVVGQIVFAVGAVAVLWVLGNNLIVNMNNANLPTGWGYLRQSGGIQLAGSDATSQTPNWELIAIAAKNTAIVSVTGILLATLIGVLLGIARLSSNWLVRKSAALYVETVRNIPVLVVIIFFAAAVIAQFPLIREPAQIGDAFIFSNRGMWMPWFMAPDGEGGLFTLLLLGAVLVGLVVARWRTAVNERTGRPHHRVLWAAATVLVLGVIAYVALGAPVKISLPVRDNLVVRGGIGVLASILGLIIGLVIYTASHIAEIVRGSIQAVPKGQVEAAQAVALSGFQRMRFIVLPQALRIMIPPLANQYLNLTKNSSLGIAIGAAELTSVTSTIIGNGRPAPQSIAVLMAIYLSFSLFISLLTNLYNRRIQYVTA